METKEMMKIKIELGEKERDSKACQLQIFLNVFMRKRERAREREEG